MKNIIPITVIVPGYNVEKMLEKVLKSIITQTYSIEEIIIIDNHSTDASVEVANKFKQKYKKIPIKIIEREKTYGISQSYNLGAKLSKTSHFVTIHSDSFIPTKNELAKLMEPFFTDNSIVAAYPLVVHPRTIWLKYNFWQKCLFATVAGKEQPSMNGKLDCYNKKKYLKIGGYDEKKFNPAFGTEDADMHWRLEKEGKVVPTQARIIHLHGIDKDYSLKDWILRRKFLAFSYGGYIRLHAKDMKYDILYFLIKPALAIIGLFSLINPFFIAVLLLAQFFYMRQMYLDPSTRSDPRIFLLPFINIFLYYYETYYTLKGLFIKKNK